MSEPIQPGSIVGDRYEILEPLGSGGFATIYEARHLHMDRRVAIKILNLVLDVTDAPEFEDRFLMEAKAASQIEHNNVVTIYDFGFTGKKRQPYMAMQLLEGRDLYAELSRNGPMDPERALRLIRPCLDGLAEAHEQGIVHKDLKPSNLFLRRAGTPREALCILDFGLACIVDQDVSRLTSSGNLLGTPKYLAPEYIKDQTASPALDVYQMGLIFTEMLTGTSVIQAEQVYACIMAHCSGSLKIPAALGASPLGPILARAMAFEHGDRYPDARAMLEALDGLSAEVIPARSGGELCLISSLHLPGPEGLGSPKKPIVTPLPERAENTQDLHRVGDKAEDAPRARSAETSPINTPRSLEVIRAPVAPPEPEVVKAYPQVIAPEAIGGAAKEPDEEDDALGVLPVPPPMPSRWLAIGAVLVVLVGVIGVGLWAAQEPPVGEPSSPVETTPARPEVPVVEERLVPDAGLALVEDTAPPSVEADSALPKAAVEVDAGVDSPEEKPDVKSVGRKGQRLKADKRNNNVTKSPVRSKASERGQPSKAAPDTPPKVEPKDDTNTVKPMKVVP